MLDLRKAYLQIRIGRELWPFQRILFRGQIFQLTRLGFGLCSAPKIMSRIIGTVLQQDADIERVTSHYIDDIIIDQNVCSVERVRQHLENFRLECKPTENFRTARMLGLQLAEVAGRLRWSRGNEVPTAEEVSD